MDQKSFAAHVGVSQQRVSKAIKAGVLSASVTVLKGKGRGGKDAYLIDPEKGLAEWNTKRDISRVPDPEKAEVARELAAELELDTKSAAAKNYATHKSRREEFAAKMAELEYLERAGELVRVEDVKRDAFKMARAVRDNVLNVPGRLVAEIATMNDAHAIEQLLMQHLSDALEELGRVR